MFKLNAARFLALTLIVVTVSLILPIAASAHTGNKGCTPGYWKNHTASWPAPYLPGSLVSAYFPAAVAYSSTSTATLLQALDFGGGAGAEGAARILLRAGVAGLLNAGSGFYPFTVTQVTTIVNSALASGSRDTMLHWATIADAYNNLGCPLN